jgi:hypothetical protein
MICLIKPATVSLYDRALILADPVASGGHSVRLYSSIYFYDI